MKSLFGCYVGAFVQVQKVLVLLMQCFISCPNTLCEKAIPIGIQPKKRQILANPIAGTQTRTPEAQDHVEEGGSFTT